MNTINLIYPQKSDISFSIMLFPDGQPHIKMDGVSMNNLDKKQPLRIFTRIAGSNDLLQALFIKNVLDYQEFDHVELHISYLLTARMDRVMVEGEPFSLKVVANMLNQADFKKIKIFDPHSEVSTALIDRSYAVPNHSFVKQSLAKYFNAHPAKAYCLVSPDAGALKKIHKLAQYLEVENIVECMKERDVKTGKLTKFSTATENFNGLTCFIVDDICDGGGTFVGTASMLKEKGAGKVVLIVSHGIFSKGTQLENIDEIYTTDSFKPVENCTCFPIEEFM
ncbi:phosphoribosyltransferase family protein [Flavitalea flava]